MSEHHKSAPRSAAAQRLLKTTKKVEFLIARADNTNQNKASIKLWNKTLGYVPSHTLDKLFLDKESIYKYNNK